MSTISKKQKAYRRFVRVKFEKQSKTDNQYGTKTKWQIEEGEQQLFRAKNNQGNQRWKENTVTRSVTQNMTLKGETFKITQERTNLKQNINIKTRH